MRNAFATNGLVLFLTAFALGSPAVLAQAPKNAAAPTTDDAVSEQASKWEAELSKVRDTTPEAAETMLKLVQLYHDQGRALGLIRIGNRFVASQAGHPQHASVMLKLLDGLVATSRNKEVTAVSRQFLQRYPADPQRDRVETILAEVLERSNDRLAAADVYQLIWEHRSGAPEGREAGVRAIWLFNQLSNNQGYVKAAELAEAMLTKLPANEFLVPVGWQAVQSWQRANQPAPSNRAAQKMLARKLPQTPTQLRDLYSVIADNYSRQGQRTNAVDALVKARQLGDGVDLHRRQISELHAGNCTAAELEPVVNDYFQKYPTQADRFAHKILLAYAYVRGNERAKMNALLREVLPHDARSHEAASLFLRESGNEPEKLADSERVLLSALEQNKKDAYFIRWVLAFDLYRDRLKDLTKARQYARDLVLKSPSNDGYGDQATRWLLYNVVDDADFDSLTKGLLQVRKENLHWTQHKEFFANWVREARRVPDQKARVARAQLALDQADQDPFTKDWATVFAANRPNADEARARLLKPSVYQGLNDSMAWYLAQSQAESYRNVGTAPQRARAIDVYAQMAARFPQDYQVALWHLQVATDYGPAEACGEAARKLLTLEPKWNDADAWRRLFMAAEKLKDGDLAQQALAWVQKSAQKFGPDPNSASYVGDVLKNQGHEAAAVDYWKQYLTVNRDHWESRSCAERLANRLMGPERQAFLEELVKAPSPFIGSYALWLAGDWLKANDLDKFEKTLREAKARLKDRPFTNYGMDEYPPQSWVDQFRGTKDLPEAAKRQVFTVLRDMKIGRPSAVAQLALLELPLTKDVTPMGRLLAYQQATLWVESGTNDWDRLMPYAQAAMARRDYVATASLLSGLLSNIPNVDENRKKAARDGVAQSYARMGGVGLAIDESSPIAPLLQSALYLRLGDDRLALEAYLANKQLFDAHRDEVPVDLIIFVAEHHIAAGGEENHDRAEDLLRNWLVKFSDAPDLENALKARIQNILAKNYFKAQQFDVARSEFTSVMNRYPNTLEAIEAEFGIGECYMAQKVYDQAETVFEKLANSQNRDVMVRAEFLRGVLASRRGDREQARDIFKNVLELVPNLDLANLTLFNLSEVYAAEQRYVDQLELLRTVGRLGRRSKRYHTPGVPLAIVVQDSDLGISRGHSSIPVRVITEPGGDVEVLELISGGAGKGLFRADLETRLGQVTKGDNILQISGQDIIRCDYPEEFKAQFRNVPLADAEIRIAASARFEAASSKIVDAKEESLSDRLAREEREAEALDKRRSQDRPANQIKPGNSIYLRVQDLDRDLSPEADQVIVRLMAASGDQVQVQLQESGPHTGIFEGTSTTGELPAGALASDTSIDHSPLMAIDRDLGTAWVSEPDGATPKWLSIDMKDLRLVTRVKLFSPDPNSQVPVRGTLEGSHDGRFWFRIASQPPEPLVDPVAGEFGQFTQRVYLGNYLNYTTWKEVVTLTKNGKAVEEQKVDALAFKRAAEHEDAAKAHAIVWHGKFAQPRSGAVRFQVKGPLNALSINGRLELPLGKNTRTVDVWLDRGTHDLTIFTATNVGTNGVEALLARENPNSDQIVLIPFREVDFDLTHGDLQPAPARALPDVEAAPGVWNFRFDPLELRFAKFVVQEYKGAAVAVNHVEISGLADDERYIPTEADVLSLANNQTLEIAAGDTVLASYLDEFTPSATGASQLLTVPLQATYFNAQIASIGYDFDRQQNGNVVNIRKEVVRIDPGQRFVVEITDYDQDQTASPDQVRFTVAVNDGAPVEFVAQETEEYSGLFTKEIDTLAPAPPPMKTTPGKTTPGKTTPAKPLPGKTTAQPDPSKPAAPKSDPNIPKLNVKPGDRIYVTYLDTQNTFPGHSVGRETVVYVAEPTEAEIRIVEARVIRSADETAPPQTIYLPPKGPQELARTAFEAPFTIEVIDPDAARDSRSKLIVKLKTSDGAAVEVECVVSDAYWQNAIPGQLNRALEEGRFLGQVIMQLGSQHSPDLVPLTIDMPRNLVGGPVLAESGSALGGQNLVTRVLNLSGKDIITAEYDDSLRPGGSPKTLAAKGRLIANGTLAATDRDYEKPVEKLHVGEKLYLRVVDADLDLSDERDTATIEITTERGEQETIQLEETLAHSGVFTGSLQLKPQETPKPGNIPSEETALETYFGDTVRLKYLDPAASTESGQLELRLELPVVVGTDGLVAAFSKVFNDENIAVETQFRIAESFFELFKSHRKLGRDGEQTSDLEAGRRILREVMEDYPDPKYIPRIAYLMGQFAQELQSWDEAIQSYRLIVRQYPDSSLAPDAQYKLAQCYEESNDFDQALEAYVTLAATYPQSPLLANVMIRISEHFYRTEQFDVAAQVGEKFLERFDGHQWAPRMAFRVGQCYYKAKQYQDAGKAFDGFAKTFPDDGLCADSLFWSGEAFRMANNDREAYRRYNRCRWDFPSSDAAKYARGRLALPNMLRQFEADANLEQ